MSFDFKQIEKVKRVYYKIKLNKHNFKLRDTPTGYNEKELKSMSSEELIDLKLSTTKYIVKNNPIIKNTTLFGLIDRIDRELNLRCPKTDTLSLNDSNNTYNSLSTNPTLASLQSKYTCLINKKLRKRHEKEDEFNQNIDQNDFATIYTGVEDFTRKNKLKKFTKRKLKVALIDRFSYNPIKVPDFLHDLNSNIRLNDTSSEESAFLVQSTKSINSKFSRSKKNSINNINDFPLRKNSNSSIIIQNNLKNVNNHISNNANLFKSNFIEHRNTSSPVWKDDDTFSFNKSDLNIRKTLNNNIYSNKKDFFPQKINLTQPEYFYSEKPNNFISNKRLFNNTQSTISTNDSTFYFNNPSYYTNFDDLFKYTVGSMFNDFT